MRDEDFRISLSWASCLGDLSRRILTNKKNQLSSE